MARQGTTQSFEWKYRVLSSKSDVVHRYLGHGKRPVALVEGCWKSSTAVFSQSSLSERDNIVLSGKVQGFVRVWQYLHARGGRLLQA